MDDGYPQIYEKGTYILVFRVPGKFSASIGRLGNFVFEKGVYYYVGSAFGNGGIRSRIRHHLNNAPSPHWHIDYFKIGARLESVVFSPSKNRLEHAWAEALSSTEGITPLIKGFGASDCQCQTHFFYDQENRQTSVIIDRINNRWIQRLPVFVIDHIHWDNLCG